MVDRLERTRVAGRGGRKGGEPEELPPARLVLTPVPLEQMSEDPARALLARTLGAVGGNAREERVHERLDLGRALFLHLGRRSLPADRTRQHAALRDLLGALLLEPVAQSQRRDAVVAVVALHGLGCAVGSVVRSAELERPLEAMLVE